MSAAAPSSPWFRSRRVLPSPRIRLVCLPYAGGGATIYHLWTDKLPADIEVRSVQLPTRQERFNEIPIKRVPPIVDRVFEELSRLPPAPTVFYGHSFGAMLGYELSLKYQAANLPLLALIVGARRAPQLPAVDEPTHVMDEEKFLHTLHHRYNTSWEILRNADLMSMALPSLRADMEAIETYVPSPGILNVPITMLRGLRDTRITIQECEAWKELTTKAFALHSVDAHHFFVDSHREWVLEQVKSVLGSLSV